VFGLLRVGFCVVFIFVCAFKQNITECNFTSNTGESGNDIYYGGSIDPSGTIVNSYSVSSMIKIFSPPSTDYSHYCPNIYYTP
jgi:hypothetical protein